MNQQTGSLVPVPVGDGRTGRVLIDRDRIARRVASLGEQIAQDIALATRSSDEQHPLVLVPVLTGSMLFVADLVRSIPLKLSIEPVTISSYPGTSTTSQGASIKGAMPTNLAGAHVLVVDDILDSGRTLGLIKRVIEAQRPASVRLAVLLAKRKVRDEPVEADYAAFEIDDDFVVGYGLDYDGHYRNLPDVMVLDLTENPPSSMSDSDDVVGGAGA